MTPETEPIRSSYTSAYPDYLAAWKYHQRQGGFLLFYAALQLIALYCLFIGGKAVFAGDSDSATFPLFFALYWFGIRKPINRINLRFRLRRSPFFNKRVDATFDAEGLSEHSKDLVESSYKWPVFIKCVLTPKGLLLYQTSWVYSWFPRHAFESDQDFEAAVAFARAKVGKFRNLSPWSALIW